MGGCGHRDGGLLLIDAVIGVIGTTVGTTIARWLGFGRGAGEHATPFGNARCTTLIIQIKFIINLESNFGFLLCQNGRTVT